MIQFYRKLNHEYMWQSSQLIMYQKWQFIACLLYFSQLYLQLNSMIHNLIDQGVRKDKVNLHFKHVSDEGIQYLCTINDVHKSKVIILRGNQITHLGIFYLSRINWKNIQQIDLWRNAIGNKGCKYLSRIPMKKVKKISLHSNYIDSAGASHLIKADWKRLECLNLINNNIGNDGARWLTHSVCKDMRKLDLFTNYITYFGLLYLILLDCEDISSITIAFNEVSIRESSAIFKLMSTKFTKMHLI